MPPRWCGPPPCSEAAPANGTCGGWPGSGGRRGSGTGPGAALGTPGGAGPRPLRLHDPARRLRRPRPAPRSDPLLPAPAGRRRPDPGRRGLLGGRRAPRAPRGPGGRMAQGRRARGRRSERPGRPRRGGEPAPVPARPPRPVRPCGRAARPRPDPQRPPHPPLGRHRRRSGADPRFLPARRRGARGDPAGARARPQQPALPERGKGRDRACRVRAAFQARPARTGPGRAREPVVRRLRTGRQPALVGAGPCHGRGLRRSHGPARGPRRTRDDRGGLRRAPTRSGTARQTARSGRRAGLPAQRVPHARPE